MEDLSTPYGARYKDYGGIMKAFIQTDPARYMLISAATLLAGMLFYGFYNKLIIIRLPMTNRKLPTEHRYARRRQTRLWYYNGERYVKDDKELIYSANTQNTLTDLVASWLSFVEEEQGLLKKVSVQSVLLDIQKQTAFISFDRNPFEKEQSVYEKLMFIESLLKTLKDSSIEIKKVQFLAQHKPIDDEQLDFSRAWTVNGYTTA